MAEQVCGLRLYDCVRNHGRLRRADVMDPGMAAADHTGHRDRSGFHARDPDHRLLYEVPGGGTAEPAAEIRRDFYIWQFVSFHGSFDRHADELCDGLALGRSARFTGDVSI